MNRLRAAAAAGKEAMGKAAEVRCLPSPPIPRPAPAWAGPPPRQIPGRPPTRASGAGWPTAGGGACSGELTHVGGPRRAGGEGEGRPDEG